MSTGIRHADARFLLPFVPTAARVLGPLEAWREALADLGVQLDSSGPPDVVVATGPMAKQAAASGARAVIVYGSGGRVALRRAGYSVRRYIVQGDLSRPELFLPAGQPGAARYVLRELRPPVGLRKTARNAALAVVFGRGIVPPGVSSIAVGVRQGDMPWWLTATSDLGVEPGSQWVLAFGGADHLSRGVFMVLPPEEPVPRWVLKFGRVPGYRQPFDDDEQGLLLVADIGGAVQRHAPRLLGRLEVEGFHASLETAGRGAPMPRALSGERSRQARMACVDKVAAWLVEVARETRAKSETLAAERRRVAEEVLPRWPGAPADLVERLPAVDAVFNHGDMGTWNILVGQGTFTAVDWEAGVRHGFPLWDLFLFLTDALAHTDGVGFGAGRDEHSRRLWRGELASSEALFRWIRSGVAATSVPESAVGPLATLHWLSIGLAHYRRAARVRGPVTVPAVERMAPMWMADPMLGPGWDRWR